MLCEEAAGSCDDLRSGGERERERDRERAAQKPFFYSRKRAGESRTRSAEETRKVESQVAEARAAAEPAASESWRRSPPRKNSATCTSHTHTHTHFERPSSVPRPPPAPRSLTSSWAAAASSWQRCAPRRRLRPLQELPKAALATHISFAEGAATAFFPSLRRAGTRVKIDGRPSLRRRRCSKSFAAGREGRESPLDASRLRLHG